MTLRQYDALERELRRLHLYIRIDRHGNARRNWAGYLLCAATVALVLGAGWWAIGLITNFPPDGCCRDFSDNKFRLAPIPGRSDTG